VNTIEQKMKDVRRLLAEIKQLEAEMGDTSGV
jgi:hypothetical protein